MQLNRRYYLVAALVAAAGASVLILARWTEGAPHAILVAEPSEQRLSGASAEAFGPSQVDQKPDRLPVAMDPQVLAHACCVHVLDTNGRPISNALVVISEGGVALQSHRTNEAGQVAITVPSCAAPYLLNVSADEYGDEQMDLMTPLPESAHVVLNPGAALRGLVKLCDGSVPRGLATVVAWATASDPVVVAGAPGVRITRADERGFFEFRDLSATASYSLACGAPGWAMPSIQRHGSVASAPWIEMAMCKVYGCLVRVKVADGSMAQESRTASWTWDTPETATPHYWPCVQLALAQFPAPLDVSVKMDWRSTMFAFTAPSDLSQLDPIRLSYAVPGMARTSVLVVPTSISSGLSETTVTLARVRDLGSLIVSWSGAPEVGRAVADAVFTTPHRLELRSHRGGSESISLPVSDLAHPLEVLNIPRGYYSMRVLLAGIAQGIDREVVVAADPVNVCVALRVGNVLLRPAHHGLGASRLSIRVIAKGRGQRPDRAQFSFHKPPYVLQGLPEGGYDLEVFTANAMEVEKKTTTEECQVKAGETTHMSVAW